MGAFSNIKGLTYYGNTEDDPYVTLEAVRFLPFLFSTFSTSSTTASTETYHPRRTRDHHKAMIIIQYTQIAEPLTTRKRALVGLELQCGQPFDN